MQSSSILKIVTAVVVAGAVIFGVTRLQSKQPEATPTTTDSGAVSSTTPATPEVTKETSGTDVAGTTTTSTAASPYKDGTYTSVGSYRSPAGNESVDVTVILKDGIITGSTVVSEANDPNSKRYQGIFIANYKQYVNGKNIDEVNLSKVSGSSLTSAGFNAALAKIKIQAKA